MAEKWKPIMDAHRFEVSNYGNIRKIGTHEVLEPLTSMKNRGKPYVAIKLDSGSTATRSLAIIVANTFGKFHSPYKYILVHKDGDEYNNSLDNLEWKPKMKSNGKVVRIIKGDIQKEFTTKTSLATYLGIERAARKNSIEVLKEAEKLGWEVHVREKVREKVREFEPYSTRDEKLTSDPETKKKIRKKVDEFVDYISKKYDSVDKNGKHCIGVIDEDDAVVIAFRKFQKKHNL